jgi:hypothetical protein
MTDNSSSTRKWAIQTMITTYAIPATTTAFAHGTSGVSVTLPLWTAGWDDTSDIDSGKNYGNLVVNVVKVSLSSAVDALGTHVGFVLPRGTPFMKEPAAANEVDIASAGDF